MNTTLDPISTSSSNSLSSTSPPSGSPSSSNSQAGTSAASCAETNSSRPSEAKPSEAKPSEAKSDTQPSTIVIQPGGALNQASSASFQKTLEESLTQASEGVIVDLLWVESTDAYGVAALVAGVRQASVLGKVLSFQSMDPQTRSALEVEWNRQREVHFGPWNDLFQQELEHFLDGFVRN